ncbi:MAG: hypothetical protein ACREBW_06315, partial [Candidatus Micrarchaeaceae archaeon]
SKSYKREGVWPAPSSIEARPSEERKRERAAGEQNQDQVLNHCFYLDGNIQQDVAACTPLKQDAGLSGAPVY